MNPAVSRLKVDRTRANVEKCVCLACPSYGFACQVKALPRNVVNLAKRDISGVDHMELLFCGFGKSDCITKPKGCICPDCQVHKDYGLQEMFYCLETGGE